MISPSIHPIDPFMKTSRLPVPATRRSPLICAASIALFTVAAQAATFTKADNLFDLNLPTSWSIGSVPGAADIALWNNTVTSASTVLLGANLSWSGLRILNPTGLVTINAGSTLTLGAGGIDMAQSLTLNNAVTLLTERTQNWTVGAGTTLQVNGALTRGLHAMLNFDTTAGGTINIATGTASTIFPVYATINKTDFAALDATKNVVPGKTSGVVTYTDNPNTGAALPTLGVTNIVGVYDVVNSNTNAISAFRLGNTFTVTGGVRFNTPHAGGQDWVVDINTRNYNTSNSSVLVTPGVGAKNVIYNSSTGSFRMGGNTELLIHQHNTAGDLILNAQITQAAAGAFLTKDGAGRLILASSTNGYSGPTKILEGTLQLGNGGTTGAIVAGTAVVNHGTLAFNHTDGVVFNNPISGTGAVTQAGAGTLSLTGTNTYTGATSFNAGTTTFTALANFGTGTALNFGGGTLQWAGVNTVDISTRTVTLTGTAGLDTNGNNVPLANSIGNAGAGGLTKSGAGTLTLGNASGNSYSGSTLVSGGTLLANNTTGSATGSGPVTVGNGATLGGTGAIAGVVTVNSGGTLAPGASVESLAVGGLTLSASSLLTYEFATTLSYDVVNVGNLDGLTINGGAISLFAENSATPWSTPGTYNLFTYSGTLGGTGFGALTVANQQGGFNYSFDSTPTTVRLKIETAGVIAHWNFNGSDSWNAPSRWTPVIPNGAGQTARFDTVLSGAASVALDGNKTLGALVFDSASNGYTITPGSGGTLTLNNNASPASMQVVSGSHTIAAPVSLTSNTSVDVVTGGTLTISNSVGGAGTLTKTGNGTLKLTGTSNYGSGTILQLGTVEFNSLAALGTGAITFNGGKLRWLAANIDDISTRTVTIDINGATLDTNGNDVILANAIGNSGAGGLTKTGGGTLTLAFANNYTGTTTITGGKLSVSANDQLGNAATGAGVIINGGTLLSSTTFNLDNFGLNLRPVTLGASGGTIETADLTTLTLTGALGGSGILTKTGGGILALNANNFGYTAGAHIDGGTIRLGGGDPNGQNGIGTGPVVFDGGTLEMNGHGLGTTPGYGTLTNALSVALGKTGTLKMPVRGAVTSTLTGAGTFNLVVDYVRGDWNGNASTFTGQINVSSRTGTQDFRVTNGNGFVNAKLHLLAGVYTYQNFNPPNGGETVQQIGELSGDAGSFIAGNPVGGRFVNWTVGALGTDSAFAGVLQDTPATGTGLLITPGQARFTKVGGGILTLSGLNTFTGAATISAGTIIAASDSPLGGVIGVGVFGAGTTLNPATTATIKFITAAPVIPSLAKTGAGTSSVLLGDAVGGTPTVLTTGGNNATTTYSGAIGDLSGTNPLAVGSVTKVGTGTFTLSGVQTYRTLNGNEGAVVLDSALGTGTSIVNVIPTAGTSIVRFGVSQTLAEVNIGDGGTLVLGGPPPAPAPFAGDFEAAGDLATGGAQAVPEPGSAALLLGGMLTLLGLRRRA